ncbi:MULTISPECIES: hypothetical protein [Chryseobacterium]|uniref:hypothetical protein n=1 Tax=Chryseobacterium sp. R2A-55 TaxID=2744445 RepID=UPI001F17E443|nr:hypothetical protein [Chryseobacterium sp. R2A-55]
METLIIPSDSSLKEKLTDILGLFFPHLNMRLGKSESWAKFSGKMLELNGGYGNYGISAESIMKFGGNFHRKVIE